MTIINLADHPNNNDRDAVLVSGPVFRGRDVYRSAAGFVATLPGCMALAGVFPTREAAELAQDGILGADRMKVHHEMPAAEWLANEREGAR